LDMAPLRKPNLTRLASPIPWRPALQIGDAGYRIPKPALRALILSAKRAPAGLR
jgi:hypothetical protein